MRRSRDGFGILGVLLITAVILTIAGLGFFIYEQNKDISKNTTADPPKNQETIIYGYSEFTEQGPTDAPIGKKPASATLVLASETAIRKIFKPVESEDGSIAFYQAAESDMKSNGARVTDTTKGEYELALNGSEDTICLVTKYSVADEPPGNNAIKYQLIGGCDKINNLKSRTHIDIHTIADGANQLECIPENSCTGLAFKYD